MLTDRVIHARNVRKNYGGRLVLDVGELSVDKGEIFALLGPNGAGKTTFTEILEGLRERDSGEITVLGEDPGTANAAWRTNVGVVLQDSHDYPQLTVREILAHFASLHAHARDVTELLEAVGLREQQGRRASRLSGGQRRRLDVALGLIGNPELLFLDEPTTGFDPEARRQFWELVKRLRADGTTIVLTTHYLDEAEYLADRVAVIADGRVLDVDTPGRLGGRHLTKAVVGWTDEHGPHRVETDDPTAAVVDLAGRYGGSIPQLTVARPSLEDVYLHMIGDNT
ncbi:MULTISPECIES: ABC transporter ATP-binding protein [unclassified Streptomyces]|uniref:ABC transporter ATP-binding protein n=1 Tax=unclassified Streptomyces TaxID=2593676 RepID=UPI00352CDB1B